MKNDMKIKVKNDLKKDKSTPYRTMGCGKIVAPSKVENSPKGTKIANTSDLRGGNK